MIFAHTSALEHALTTAALVIWAVIYLAAWSRTPNPRLHRVISFAGGIFLIVIALSPTAESFADETFTAHMIQHLILYGPAPPLIVMARPLATLNSIVPARFGSSLHALPQLSRTSPIFATGATIIVLYSLHLTGLYDAALAHPVVHAGTHAALFLAGLTAWNIGLKPGVSDGAIRVGVAITTSVPIAILGLILTSATDPLYNHYEQNLGVVAAVEDQRAGGALMWIGAMIVGAALVVSTLLRWASHEQRIAERYESISTGPPRSESTGDRLSQPRL